MITDLHGATAVGHQEAALEKLATGLRPDRLQLPSCWTWHQRSGEAV